MLMPEEIRKVKDDIEDRISDVYSVSEYLNITEKERARLERALSVLSYKLDNLTVRDIDFEKLKEIK